VTGITPVPGKPGPAGGGKGDNMNLGEYFAKTRGTGILATSDDWGKRLYEAWAATGKGEPTVMAEVAKEIAPPRPVRPHRVTSQTILRKSSRGPTGASGLMGRCRWVRAGRRRERS